MDKREAIAERRRALLKAPPPEATPDEVDEAEETPPRRPRKASKGKRK